jgi:AcrR family transcriptional regulator
MSERRTQAERRATTQAAVLNSATTLFGRQGYANTSLEDIARDCGISVAPIYHYFGNKKNLFQAVNELMEVRVLEEVDADTEAERFLKRWQLFMQLCKEQEFRQIVLVDGPNVLGLERMSNSRVSEFVEAQMRQRFHADDNSYKGELIGRMMMAALAEAGLLIGNAEDPEQASKDAEELVSGLIAMFNNSQLIN